MSFSEQDAATWGWNPAVEDQCTDRIYRIGQEKPVFVYYLRALHPEFGDSSFDGRLHALLERKRTLSRDMLMPPVNRENDTQALYEGTVDSKPQQEGFGDVPQSAYGAGTETTLDDIDCMEPIQFEDWVLAGLKSQGFEVNKTPKSWDCGADGIAKDPKSGATIILQCKHTQKGSAVGPGAIEEMLNARSAYMEPKAQLIAVTNAPSFTKPAAQVAKSCGAVLVDRSHLIEWQNDIARILTKK